MGKYFMLNLESGRHFTCCVVFLNDGAFSSWRKEPPVVGGLTAPHWVWTMLERATLEETTTPCSVSTLGSHVAERLRQRASNLKVASSILGRAT